MGALGKVAHEPSMLGISSAIVAIYLFLLPIGLLGVWLMIFGVERLRDAGYLANLLVCCAPTYMILVLVQISVPWLVQIPAPDLQKGSPDVESKVSPELTPSS